MWDLFATAPSHCEHSFFGLVPWFHYLKSSSFAPDCTITNFNLLPGGGQASDLPFVLVAIIDDLLRIAGLVAIGLILYGAIKFVVSQGNAEDAAQARSTIINALIGLAIAIVAVAFVSFIGSKLS